MPIEPASRFVSANEIRLHFMDYGGEGPPLVLVHATGFGWWQWAPVAAALVGDFHPYAIDLRGHGDSDKPNEGYSVENFARDLDGFLDALGLEHALAVGHSVGAKTVIAHASLYPGRITRALLIEPVINPPGVERDPEPIAAQARRRRPSFPSGDAMYDSYRNRPPFAGWREEVLRLYCEQGTETRDGATYLKCSPALEALTMTASGSFDVWAHLPRIVAPTRFLWGERGLGRDVRDDVLRVVRISDAHTVPRTTHALVMEAPDAIVAEARDFFLGQICG